MPKHLKPAQPGHKPPGYGTKTTCSAMEESWRGSEGVVGSGKVGGGEGGQTGFVTLGCPNLTSGLIQWLLHSDGMHDDMRHAGPITWHCAGVLDGTCYVPNAWIGRGGAGHVDGQILHFNIIKMHDKCLTG